MGKTSAAIEIPATPNEVWQLIGGFDSLPDWLGYVPKSELGEDGRVRHLANLKGETIVERLEEFDNTAHGYSYSIIQAPFPATGYLSTHHVKPAADGKSRHLDSSLEMKLGGAMIKANEARLHFARFGDKLLERCSRLNNKSKQSILIADVLIEAAVNSESLVPNATPAPSNGLPAWSERSRQYQ